MGKHHLNLLFLGLTFSLITYQNCSPMHSAVEQSELGSSINTQADFQKVSEIFGAKCVACHQVPDGSNGNVGLSTYQDVMGSGAVIEGDSSQSLLFQSINSGRMPPGLPLTQAEIDTIALWIDQGALDVVSDTGNVLPTVQAGANRSLTLPTNSVVIDAVATDNDGSVVAILWTQVSGPNMATLSGANTLSLSASNLIEGSYVFQIEVEDNSGGVSTDSITVSVNSLTSMVSFAQLSRDIFIPRCTTCHGANRADGGYRMHTYNNLMQRVVAGNAQRSELYTEVLSNSMPRNATPLTNAEKSLIQTWINQGALNN